MPKVTFLPVDGQLGPHQSEPLTVVPPDVGEPESKRLDALRKLRDLLEAVCVGKPDVQQRENGLDGRQQRLGFGPATSGDRLVTRSAQLRAEKLVKCGVVLDDDGRLLRAFGVRVEERPAGLVIEGRSEGRLRACAVDSHGDHRIAMMAAILSLRADGPSVVRDVDCISTSYPGFVSALRSIGARVCEEPLVS